MFVSTYICIYRYYVYVYIHTHIYRVREKNIISKSTFEYIAERPVLQILDWLTKGPSKTHWNVGHSRLVTLDCGGDCYAFGPNLYFYVWHWVKLFCASPFGKNHLNLLMNSWKNTKSKRDSIILIQYVVSHVLISLNFLYIQITTISQSLGLSTHCYMSLFCLLQAPSTDKLAKKSPICIFYGSNSVRICHNIPLDTTGAVTGS